jgi:hypothetical protein
MWTKAGGIVICGFAVIKLLLGGSAHTEINFQEIRTASDRRTSRSKNAKDPCLDQEILYE